MQYGECDWCSLKSIILSLILSAHLGIRQALKQMIKSYVILILREPKDGRSKCNHIALCKKPSRKWKIAIHKTGTMAWIEIVTHFPLWLKTIKMQCPSWSYWSRVGNLCHHQFEGNDTLQLNVNERSHKCHAIKLIDWLTTSEVRNKQVWLDGGWMGEWDQVLWWNVNMNYELCVL